MCTHTHTHTILFLSRPPSFCSFPFFFFFLLFLTWISQQEKEENIPDPKTSFSVFFFFPLVVFHNSPYIFSLFFLTRPPPFYSNFFFFFLRCLYLFSHFGTFSPITPSPSKFSNSIFAVSTLNLSVIFKWDYFFSLFEKNDLIFLKSHLNRK